MDGEIFSFMDGVFTVLEDSEAPVPRSLLGEEGVVHIDVPDVFPSLVLSPMILIACTRWIDAHPSIVVVWGIVQFEADRFVGHCF